MTTKIKKRRFRVKLTVTEMSTVSKLVEAESGDAARKKVEMRWREQNADRAYQVLEARADEIGG